MSNFDGRDEVRVQMTVTEKWADQKRIKANLQNQDGKFPHNINVSDQALMAVLEADKTYEVTIQRGNGKPDGSNKDYSYGYFWNLIEIHQEQAPVEEGHMVRAAVAMGARVINETENKQAPKPFSEWRESAEERKQKSIERQQLIVFANNILTAHDEIQIKLGNTDNVSTTMNDRLIRIKAIARSLEPHFATGFQEQVLTDEVNSNPKDEFLTPLNEAPTQSAEQIWEGLDQPSSFDLNDPDQRV
jgi:hypothetical protein